MLTPVVGCLFLWYALAPGCLLSTHGATFDGPGDPTVPALDGGESWGERAGLAGRGAGLEEGGSGDVEERVAALDGPPGGGDPAPDHPRRDRIGTDAGGGPQIAGCPTLPADNPWNQDISKLPVHPRSAAYLASIGVDRQLHPDFGTTWQGAPNGIPFVVVPPTQPKVPVAFTYASESDPGPYPIPVNAPIEGGPSSTGDRHVIVVQQGTCLLYELFAAHPSGRGWRAGSGARFDLRSNKLRPAGWTSADAAGLPILPGLVRYDEVVLARSIRHALRFTAPRTRRAYVSPARHFASTSRDQSLPPMGLRVRLKRTFATQGFPPAVRVILEALKRYGMILADNGSSWFISGAPDKRWNDSELSQLHRVKGRDLEVVYTGKATEGK